MILKIKFFESKTLPTAGYDASLGLLRIWLTDDSDVFLEYKNVPLNIWAGLLDAHDPFQYFASHIRDIYRPV